MPTFKNVTGQEIRIQGGAEQLVFAPGETKDVREEQCEQLRGNGSFREVQMPVVASTEAPAPVKAEKHEKAEPEVEHARGKRSAAA